MASSSSTPYKVFVSHAGEDKTTIAFPLRDKLLQHGITAFVDEKDMPGGTWSEEAMMTAMETADIAVVVLSPEFVAKKWPMKELFCFLRRSGTPLGDGRRLPVIIPLFYRLSIEELYDEPKLSRLDKNGKSLYQISRFFERMEKGEPETNIDKNQTALRKLDDAMGVENYVNASNENGSIMLKRRNVLLNEIIEEVRKAVRRIFDDIDRKNTGSEAEGGEFRPHYHKERSISDLVLDFHGRDEVGNTTTTEGSLLQVLLDRSENTSAISIQGIGGVGKTSILRGLSCEDEVIERFRDEVYFLYLGADATRNGMMEGLCKMVKDSGGERKSNEMREEKDWKEVMNGFRSWFAEQKCLFMIDDVRETTQITSDVVHELSILNTCGSETKVVFTTRSMEIASRADKCFVLEPHEAESRRCRDILMLHSRTEVDESRSECKRAVTEILRKCAGLPLFLKLAGRAVRALSMKHGSEVSYRHYSRTFDVSIQGMLNTDTDSYDALASSLSVSLGLLEHRKPRWGFIVRLSACEMHRRLCVLRKQSRVPMSMLKHLWELRSEAEASIVAREFEQIALATLYIEELESGDVEFLGVHDSLHEYALSETRVLGEEKLGHKILVEGYGRGLEKEEDCPAWWSRRLKVDGYVHNHICEHLLLSGLEDELVSLLLKPEWTIRSFDVYGILQVERDYGFGIRIARKLRNECEDMGHNKDQALEVETALEMISKATRLSCMYRISHPRESCFQLYGRLKTCSEENVVTEEYLNRLEEKGKELWEPWLKCTSSFLTSPGGATSRVCPIGLFVNCMVMNEDCTIVLLRV